ncbi:MAG TPA: hypothetical protein VK789_15260 [Bryobacteraceae bacterium]|nr:hypothetical protein [Bryobacteraceae bacterium]
MAFQTRPAERSAGECTGNGGSELPPALTHAWNGNPRHSDPARDPFAQDKDGKPVTDLNREDFQIFDNGKPQEIRLFLADQTAVADPEAAAAASFSNKLATGGHGGYAVLHFDNLSVDPAKTVFAHMARARQKGSSLVEPKSDPANAHLWHIKVNVDARDPDLDHVNASRSGVIDVTKTSKSIFRIINSPLSSKRAFRLTNR